MTRSERSIREEAQARISSLVKAYQSAGDEIKATLTQAALTEAGQARAQSHLQQIDAIITALNAEAVDSAHSLTAFGFGQGKDLSVEALRRHGITLPREFGTGINTSAVQSVADQMAQDLLEANGTLGANARRILRKTKQNVLSEADINDKVSQGLMEGSTRNQMVSRLRDAFVKELDGAALIEVGDGEKLRHYEPGYYAKMVAHTRHREAVTEGIMNTAHEADVTLFRWSIHEGACPLCQQYQGKVYSSGGESKFPPLTEKPPLHPFCEHVLTAFVEDYYDAGELKRYEQMSNDAGYVHSTSDWNRAMNGDGTLHSEPWLPEGSGSGKGKAGESTAKSAENAKKSESQRAQRGAEDRPKSKKPSTTETPGQPNSVPESPGQANKHDANRLSSLANDTRAIVDPKATGYTTYQDGKQFLRFPHPGIKSEADFNAMLAKPIIFPEDISVDMVQVLNKTLSELVGDSHRLATPPIRGLQFSERKALASMGDGVLG